MDAPDPTHWYHAARPDRTEIIACTICDSTTESCDDRPGWYHGGRRWAIGLTHPGNGIGTDLLPDRPGSCSATVEQRSVRANRPAPKPWLDYDWQLEYRGACLGCGWAGPTCVDDENRAVEDAHDHACPGWRALPSLNRTGSPHDDRHGRARWLDNCRRAFLAAGLDPDLLGTGWPIRTTRPLGATRSHWSYEIAGYDICGTILDELDDNSPALATSQPTLF